ncbi:protein kinase domain-containing protein [Streptomyces sp. TRM68367]|uniref:protein kinase domain-containing protein n=1 Tax=Streptomyces sp. TRM68367 TaxID=2758415 RepID=UPI002934D742|nr:protein kinase [Streptomyces sp. TRM68367]
MPPDEAAVLRQAGAAPLRLGDPARVGPYVPLALLGSGGMGRVYLARPAHGGTGLVAVKVIRPEYAEDIRFRRRFEREAAVHDRVRSPHTPRLCGTGFQDELLWMATEYLPGLDLADAVREDGALGASAVWRLVADLGQALADLAAAGIVHRDLKPSNVLLSARGAHLIDFGISKAADASAITGTGNRVGTPAYMSPEHLRTGHSDTASDVFSLAGTLVYAASGRAPFGDGTGVDVMHRVAFEEPNPGVIGGVAAADADLAALLSACLAKEPEQRPTPQDLIEAAAQAQPANPGWPEPLGGRALARQRAYEALYDRPVERMPGARTPGARTPGDGPQSGPPNPAAQRTAPSIPAGRDAVPPVSAERTEQPAPSGSEPPAEQAHPAATPALGQLRLMGTRLRERKKSVLALAGGLAVCAVAAGILVLTRQDAPATASTPGDRATAPVASTSGDPAAPSKPGASYGMPGPDGGAAASPGGAAADGRRDPVEAGATPRPDASGTNDGARPNDPSAPTAEPSAPTDATPPSTNPPPPEPETPPWISDCTYYSGIGRTRQGDSGKRVLQAQCMLTKRGYGVGGNGVDGEFGPGTEAAVRSFQSDKGLDADGIVGRATWSALRSTD